MTSDPPPYPPNWPSLQSNYCYHFYPLTLPDNTTRYLELQTRKIHTFSHKIPCDQRPDPIFIKDHEGELWKYSLNTGFTKVQHTTQLHTYGHLILPKISTPNSRLMHKNIHKPHRQSLLHFVTLQQENVQKLADISDVGNSSIVRGLAILMSNTIQTTIKTGSDIFHTVAKGFVSITNSTTEVLTSTAGGVSSLLKFFSSGISGIFTYLIIIGIVAFITWAYINRKKLPQHTVINETCPVHTPQRL